MNQLFLDTNGLMVQRDGDGGDCAARCGEYLTLRSARFLSNIPNDEWPFVSWETVKWNLVKNGYVYRYNQPPYNDLTDVSRDQTMPIVIAAGYALDFQVVDAIFHRTTNNW